MIWEGCERRDSVHKLCYSAQVMSRYRATWVLRTPLATLLLGAALSATWLDVASAAADTGAAVATSKPVSPKKPRARELGVPFEGQPGPDNAITDVPGVEVGQVTLISGTGPLVVGKGPVRTGVTAILPRGKTARPRSVSAVVCLNGNGELTGSHWVNESGLLESPILITNTEMCIRDRIHSI